MNQQKCKELVKEFIECIQMMKKSPLEPFRKIQCLEKRNRQNVEILKVKWRH